MPAVRVHDLFAASGGNTLGPFSATQVAEGIARSEITPETLVWTAGMAGWLPASQVPQLAGYFNASPPPPPAEPSS